MKIIIALLSLLVAITAAQQQSLCDKYSAAKNLTNLALMTTIVGDTFAGLTASTSPVLDWFNGVKNGIDYTDPANKNQTDLLAAHLVQWFGRDLQCTDPTFPTYGGNPSMSSVHSTLGLGASQIAAFNKILTDVLGALGVSNPDILFVKTYLNGFYTPLCSVGCKTSICDIYSNLLNITNRDLITAVVGGTFTTVLATPSLRKFFDGTLNGTTNYVTNTTNAAILGAALGTFFGAALQCTDGTVDPYTGDSNMTRVHEHLPITSADFDGFNNILLGVLQSYAVIPAHVTAVSNVLNGTRSAICNTNCAPPPVNPPPATGATPSPSETTAPAMIAAPAILLLALLLLAILL